MGGNIYESETQRKDGWKPKTTLKTARSRDGGIKRGKKTFATYNSGVDKGEREGI